MLNSEIPWTFWSREYFEKGDHPPFGVPLMLLIENDEKGFAEYPMTRVGVVEKTLHGNPEWRIKLLDYNQVIEEQYLLQCKSVVAHRRIYDFDGTLVEREGQVL